MHKLKVYSPNQIVLGSFFGGPIAAIYFLYKNYITLDKREYAKKTILIGSLLCLVLLGALPFLPEEFPNMLIPMLYSMSAKHLAYTTQLSKENINNNKKYLFESNWKVFGIATLSLIFFLVISMASMYVLDAFNIIHLNEF